jgi:hypothetical protein
MLLVGDPTASIGYVTVGLFSSAVLRNLFAIEDAEAGNVQTDAIDNFAADDSNLVHAREAGNVQTDAIDNAIKSLKALEDPSSKTGVPPHLLAFRTYEGASTLFEVLEDETQLRRPSDVASLLENVLAPPPSPTRKALALSAIAFFRKLSRQASINSQMPEQGIPARVRELARTIA